MLKKLITGALWSLLSALFDSNIKTNILGLVEAQMSASLDGPEKKRVVMEKLYLLGDDAIKVFESVGNYIVSMAVDIAVGYLKSRLGK